MTSLYSAQVAEILLLTAVNCFSALMIHGGGYVTLSKKAVRHHQTSFSLSQNVLPVSIDHRLCPEINLIAGPIRDVRDAYAWIKNGGLQRVVQGKEIQVDSEKVLS